MDPGKRVQILVIVVVVTAFVIHFLNLSPRPMSFVADMGVSFVLSGVFYGLLRSAGLGFLEEIQVKFVSLMTVAIFVLKHLLI
jgi:hypothetical protein